MPKIDVSTSILEQSSHFYLICMNLEQFLNEELLKNDAFRENHFKLENQVKTKQLEPVV